MQHQPDRPGVIFPPPLLMLLALVAAVALNHYWPLRAEPRPLAVALGALLSLLGIGIAAWGRAFALAISAIASRQDPQVARDTSAFLQEQTQLLRIQKEHLKDEHALRLENLEDQIREVGIRRFGLYLRMGFQIFLALAATVIGLGAAAGPERL